MYKLILENPISGGQIEFNKLGGPLTITEILGLNPPTATINTNEAALIDGAIYNSAKVQMRSINLAFAVEYEAEKHRIEVYKVLRIKKPIRLYYKSDYRDVYIDGYLESLDDTRNENKLIMTATILCPSPFFKAAQEVVNELEQTIGAFHFPFSSTAEPQIVFGYIDTESSVTITNDGEVDTGMTISLYARGAVVNPTIYNYVTGESLALNYSLEAGDLVTFTTGQGNKRATLLRDGVETSLFNYIGQGSEWLTLTPGDNEFVYTADSGATLLSVTIRHSDLFEGV